MIKALFCIFIGCLFLTPPAQACQGNAPKDLNVGVDLEQGSRFYYNKKKVFRDKPQINLQNCGQAVSNGEEIMIAVGIENNVLTNQVAAYSYNDVASTFGDSCKLINNPFEFQDPKERHAKLHERRKILNECITIQITDFASGSITYPEEQPGCKITKVSEKSIDMKGAFCYVTPRMESTFSIHVEVNPACKTREFLIENKLSPQDINAVLNTYKAGDSSGTSGDLTAITTTNLRFSINSPKEIMPVSDNYGLNRPTWPSQWSGAHIDMGNFSIQGRSELADTFSTSFVVDNRCERKCVNGLCSSMCDYAQPIIAQHELFELVDGKYEYLKTWYDGGIASAQWQGMLFGIGHDMPKGQMETGKKYRLEILIDEPDFTFHQFNGRFSERIRLRGNHIPDINRNGGFINPIPIFDTIRNGEVIPELSIITGIDFHSDGLGQLLRNGVQSFQAYLNNSFWPPFYEELCNPITGSCQPMGSGKVKLTVDFELGEKDLDEGTYYINNPIVSKETSFGPGFSEESLLPKRVRCRRVRRPRPDEENNN